MRFFSASPGQSTVLFNTASQFIGRFISTGTTFIVSVLLVQTFGAAAYGDFIKVTSFIAPFYLLADFGMNAIYVQREKSLQKQNDASLWYSLFTLRFIGALVLTFIVISLLALLPMGIGDGYTKIVRLGIILFSVTILFQSATTSANAFFQNRLEYKYSAIAVFFGSLVTLVLIWTTTYFISSDASALVAAISVATGAGISAVTSFFIVKRLIGSSRFSVQKREMIFLLKESIPLGIMLLLNLIYFRFDTFVIVLTRSTTEVGIYGFVYKFFEAFLVFPTFFMNSLYPMFFVKKSQRGTHDSTELKKIIGKAGVALGLVSFLAMILLWVASGFLPLLRKEFMDGIPVLRVLALGLPFFYVSSLTMWSLIALGKQWVLTAIYGISMVGNILVNILFIPKGGIMIAAWTTTLSEALVFCMSGALLLQLLLAKKEASSAPQRFLTPD